MGEGLAEGPYTGTVLGEEGQTRTPRHKVRALTNRLSSLVLLNEVDKETGSY